MSDHRVTFIFEDGYAAAVAATERETVYQAALRSDIRLQSDCLEGACATCKALCTRGEFELSDYSDEALSADEAKEGYVLQCRMRARSDCVLQVPYESSLAIANRAPAAQATRVAALERVSSSVFRLDVEPVDGTALGFLPGQYVHLKAPGVSAVRYYSFANSPSNGRCTFYVRALPQGVMSEYLANRAKVGDPIELVGPYGQFYLRAARRSILMVAGGTGLAPMLSMLDHLADQGGCAQPVRLLYGANRPDELFALEQLRAYPSRGVPLALECAVVSADAGWSGSSGHVTSLLREDLIGAGDCDAYLCGPPQMIDAAQAWLAAHGVAPGRIHAERFLPS